MMSPKGSSLIKSSSIYTIGGVVGTAVPFLLLPILTRYLSPEDYGLIATFQAILGVTIPFVGVNITNAITRSFYDLKKSDLAIYTGNCLMILAVSFLAVFLIFFIFRDFISSFTNIPASWLLIIPFIAAGRFLFNTILTIWRVTKKAVAFSTYNFLMTATNYLITILLVVVLSMDWKGRILGLSISNILFGIIGVYILCFKGYLTFAKNKDYIKDALVMGIPLIPHALGAWARNLINRLFLNRMVDLSATGLFSVGYNLGSIISLFQGAFHQAWVPWLYSKLKQNCPEENLKIVKFTYLYNILSIIAALALAKIAQWVLPWFLGEDFAGASEFIIWIALGLAADGMHKMVACYIYYMKKTYILAYTTVFTGLLSVILNYILIKANGAIGAAQATTITFYVGYLLTWFMANRIFPMPWNLKSH